MCGCGKKKEEKAKKKEEGKEDLTPVKVQISGTSHGSSKDGITTKEK